MTGFPITAVDRARAAASRELDLHWPVRRGVEVSQAEARKAIRAFAGGESIYEHDHATADAHLSDLLAGGLLERRWDTLLDWVYVRPEADFDWAAHEEQTKSNATVTMFHGWDGAEPRPWLEVGAELEQRRLNPTPMVLTVDERIAALEARIAQLEAEKSQQTTTTADAEDAPADDKKGKRRWLV